MRFCMVTTFYPPRHFGGDAVYVRTLSQALARAGHHVEVVCSDDAYLACGGREPLDAGETAMRDGVIVHRLRSSSARFAALWAHQTGGPGPARGALSTVLDAGFDVIHFHNVSLVGGPGVFAMGRARAKLMTLHDHWLVCPTHVLWKNGERACDRPTCFTCSLRARRPPQLWRYGDLLGRSLERVDLVLAPSEWSLRRHREDGISRPIERLPLCSQFDVAAPQRSAGGRPTFLYAGRLTASKGVRSLVERFASLREFDLVVAGDGELREALTAEFSRCPNVRFAGPVDGDSLAAFYANATATLVPSLAPESFGLVAVESAAFGTPVVALDAGGLGEVVRDLGGIVCTNLDALVREARRLAADPATRERLGSLAREACRSRYTVAGHLAAYLACAAGNVAAH